MRVSLWGSLRQDQSQKRRERYTRPRWLLAEDREDRNGALRRRMCGSLSRVVDLAGDGLNLLNALKTGSSDYRYQSVDAWRPPQA
jgi:hypothetical protein